MRKSSKLILIGGALVALAVPSASMAATPDGSIVAKAGTQSENASPVGVGSSVLKQNGQFVGGNTGIDSPAWWQDQTTTPGSRGDMVQALLGHENTGKR